MSNSPILELYLKHTINFRKADDYKGCGNCRHARLLFHVRFWCDKYDFDLPPQYSGTMCDWYS